MSSILKSSATTKRKALKASASMLGLAAGAIGWSGLANAASDESGPQTLLLPNHYRLMDDGVVVQDKFIVLDNSKLFAQSRHKGRLTFVECFPIRAEGVHRHPRSECGAYPKPRRMVSVVKDRVAELLLRVPPYGTFVHFRRC